MAEEIIFSMNEKELLKKAKEIYPKLIELLERECKDLIPIYVIRFHFLSEIYPKTFRLYNAIWILKTYFELGGELI